MTNDESTDIKNNEDGDEEVAKKVFIDIISSIQAIAGKTLMEVHNNREKYLNALISEDEAREDETVGEFAARILSKFHCIELLVLTTLRGAMLEANLDQESCLMINRCSWDMASALFLLNGLATKEELLEMYPKERLEVAITMFDAARSGEAATMTLPEAAENLKDLVRQHRDANKSLN